MSSGAVLAAFSVFCLCSSVAGLLSQAAFPFVASRLWCAALDLHALVSQATGRKMSPPIFSSQLNPTDSEAPGS